jgi:hypothetical protein
LSVEAALHGGLREGVAVGERTSAVLLRVDDVVLRRHSPAGLRGVVSGQRRDIAGVCDDVTLVGGGQALLSRLITLIGGQIAFIGCLIALIGGALALIGAAQARFSGLIALIGLVLALIGGALARIGAVATCLSGLIALIGGQIAFIRCLIALISGLIAPIGGVLARTAAHGVREGVIGAARSRSPVAASMSETVGSLSASASRSRRRSAPESDAARRWRA